MNQMIKTILQVIFIMSPIIYYNFNVDNITSSKGVMLIGGGIILAVLTEWVHKFIHYIRS